MKILVLTSLFPNSLKRHEGAPVLKEIKELSKLASVKVVAPLYRFPFQKGCRVPAFENWEGIEVSHPRVFVLPFFSRWLNGLLYFAFTWRTVMGIRRQFAFDAIYVRFVYPDGLAGILLGKLWKVPVALSVLGSDVRLLSQSRVKRGMVRWVLSRADRILCVSEELKKRVMELAPGAQPYVSVNYNGAPAGRRIAFNRSDFFRRHRLYLHKPVLLSVGHFIPLKNHLLLIDAMKELQTECQLVIIGDGPMQKEYEKRKRKHGLNGSVKILGPLSEASCSYGIAQRTSWCTRVSPKAFPTSFWKPWR